jgi:hypothetical protein
LRLVLCFRTDTFFHLASKPALCQSPMRLYALFDMQNSPYKGVQLLFGRMRRASASWCRLDKGLAVCA